MAIAIILIIVCVLAYGRNNPFIFGPGPARGGAPFDTADSAGMPPRETAAPQKTNAPSAAQQSSGGRDTDRSLDMIGETTANTSRTGSKYMDTTSNTTRASQSPTQPIRAQRRQAPGVAAPDAISSSAAVSGATTISASVSGAMTQNASAANTSPQSATAPQSLASSAATSRTSASSAVSASSASTSGALETGVLEGKIICLDPGHQRRQNGELEQIAPGSNTKKPKVSSGAAGIATGDMEYALNLAVAFMLKAHLEKAGAEVVMTRTEHDVDISNIERAKIGNAANADLVIRIHADSSTNREVKGISVLIPSSKHIGEELAADSKRAGQAILDGAIAASGAKNRGLSVRDDMTGFNWSKRTVMLIEMGFMSNPDEDRLLSTDDYRKKIAKGIYDGCAAYFGLPDGQA